MKKRDVVAVATDDRHGTDASWIYAYLLGTLVITYTNRSYTFFRSSSQPCAMLDHAFGKASNRIRRP